MRNQEQNQTMKATTVIVQSDNPLSRRDLVINYIRAIERFRSAHISNLRPGNNVQNESLGWAAFGEAMYWLYSFLEQNKKSYKLEFKDESLVKAFLYVRGIAQHKGRYPIATKMTSGCMRQHNYWIWGQISSKVRKGDEKKHKAYQAKLQNNEVLGTLESMARELWNLRGWQISKTDLFQPGYTTKFKIKFDLNE